MPRPHPPEFRQSAVELARLCEKPVAEIAKDLGSSDSCLRGWMARADVDEVRHDGMSSREREELIELRRELRVTKMENQILKRAAAYFRPGERPPTSSCCRRRVEPRRRPIDDE